MLKQADLGGFSKKPVHHVKPSVVDYTAPEWIVSNQTLEVLVSLDNLGCARTWDFHAGLAKCILGCHEILR